MIFEEIRIYNLFSYYGEQVFKFEAPIGAKNITLIYGRNGYGKTSFIESIKLLFLGASEELRKNVQRGRSFRERAYLLGAGEEWLGILNRAARRAGEKKFGITITWREPEGFVEAKRFWRLKENDDYESLLEIVPDFGEAPSTLEDAQAFLNARLPEDYVSFFIYDGEQVQTLAEANREQQLEHIERLLSLSKLDTLNEYIEKNMRKWRKEGSPSEAYHQLTILERQLAELEANLARDKDRLAEMEEDIRRLERDIAADLRYLQSMHAFSHQHQASLLQRDLENLKTRLQTLQADLMETLPDDIPLLANPKLIQLALHDLNRLIKSDSAVLSVTLKQILEDLPRDLFEKGLPSKPPLTESQRAFYRNKLINLLNPYFIDPTQSGDGIMHLELTRAKGILKVLEFYAEADELRSQRVKDLKSITTIRRDILEKEREINDMSNLSEEERERYRTRQEAHEERKARQEEFKLRRQKIEQDINDWRRRIKEMQSSIKTQRDTLKLTEVAERRVKLGQDLVTLFHHYKRDLKVDHRAKIESTINKHFSELMTAHTQIKTIRVGVDFDLHFIGQDDEPVSMAGLSAGMKQLAATALLWTLKEVSGKSVPIVIDTPLARIDRGHQENLLRRYYPQAGEQVILLPTDSELDREKYAILKPYILQEYCLENPDGEHTRPVKAAMYT